MKMREGYEWYEAVWRQAEKWEDQFFYQEQDPAAVSGDRASVFAAAHLSAGFDGKLQQGVR